MTKSNIAKALTRAASSKTAPPAARNASTRAHFLAQQQASMRIATASYHARAYRKQQQLYRSMMFILVAGGFATLTQYLLIGTSHAETPPKEEEEVEENPLVFEESRKKSGVSKEENRDLISSQHHQVKRSWESPGVYAWGSNTGKVAAPDSDETVVKTPRRIPFFDGKLLRDIKLDRNFAAAIDEQGNLLQWGIDYAPDTKTPVTTLRGKNLVSLSLSRDRILALSKNGRVYSVPVSAEEQASEPKPSESSWIPFWAGRSPISYRLLSKDLPSSEKVSLIASGLDHALLLTSTGKVFSSAASGSNYPNRGQLGVPGLTWVTRPQGAYDQPHEITTLRGFNVAQVACGDYHSLALDSEGRVFSWGDNSSGQLGFDFTPDTSIVDAPSLLPTQKLYQGSSQRPAITHIAAGGSNSYLTVDAIKVAAQNIGSDQSARLGLGKVTADTFAFGSGIYGNLANSRWTHIQGSPTKIPTLSGLFEYDETNNTTVPIRLAHLSVGATHSAAVMKNITYLDASEKTSTDDTNWGRDIVFWGGNEHYQLGTGKRNNVSTPVYIQPLDIDAEIKRAKKSSGSKEEHRFHITPRTTAKLGDGRKVSVEQKVECGRNVTCVYSGT